MEKGATETPDLRGGVSASVGEGFLASCLASDRDSRTIIHGFLPDPTGNLSFVFVLLHAILLSPAPNKC